VRVKRALAPIVLVGVLALGAAGGHAGASNGQPAAGAAGADAVAAACQSVRYGGRAYVLGKSRRVRCLFAKRWVRRLNRSRGDNSPPGWTCESGSNFRTGGSCSKGNRYFGWHPYD
jgi:hypothetical protein